MAYKVLGQVNSTGPSTAKATYNLIQDPSFENITPTGIGTLNAALTTTVKPIPGANNWQILATSSGTSTGVVVGSSANIAPAFGNESIAFRGGTGGSSLSPWLMHGWKQGTTNSNYQNNGQIDYTTATPLAPGTYYYGCNILKTTANTYWQARVGVNTFDTNGTIQNTSYTSYTNPTTANVWQSISGSFTASSYDAYAGLHIQMTGNSSATVSDAFAIDGIWLSRNNPSTFPNPIAATDTTAPFDTRGYTWDGTPNASNTVLTYPGTLTDVYTVPAGSSTVVSTVVVANMDVASTKIRIAVLPSGQTLAKKHWITLDAPLNAYSTQTFTIGMTLAAGDKIKVASDNSDTAFTVFGNES